MARVQIRGGRSAVAAPAPAPPLLDPEAVQARLESREPVLAVVPDPEIEAVVAAITAPVDTPSSAELASDRPTDQTLAAIARDAFATIQEAHTRVLAAKASGLLVPSAAREIDEAHVRTLDAVRDVVFQLAQVPALEQATADQRQLVAAAADGLRSLAEAVGREPVVPHVDVHVPEQPTPDVYVEPARVDVHVPEQAAPVVHVAAAEPAPAPVVHIAVPEQPAPVVQVTVPAQPAPVIEVIVPPPAPFRATPVRDGKGQIVEVFHEPLAPAED